MSLRRALNAPIPAIFEAARQLQLAVASHLSGDRDSAENYLRAANDQAVWQYTDRAWGAGCAKRYQFLKVANSPPRLNECERPVPRLPDRATKAAALSRDSHHCRFCGIPVIDSAIRLLLRASYPETVTWGRENSNQHAALQCMWLQFDHILPNSRGGDSFLENIVVACAPCNYGRMQTTLEEAQLFHPLKLDPPVIWEGHATWRGLEELRTSPNS